jgi:hypothetical protein
MVTQNVQLEMDLQHPIPIALRYFGECAVEQNTGIVQNIGASKFLIVVEAFDLLPSIVEMSAALACAPCRLP